MTKKLFVGNLPHSLQESELNELFAEHGEVVSARIITDRETGRPRGFAFVEMASAEEADAAMNSLNGQEVSGRAIAVNEAREREGGPPRGGGDRRNNKRSFRS